ncbi:tRNA pseudouridine synthase D [Myriangium duriaei CBS 260.36]|uniref:tRNA pseudouridine synthase D n=1 Tax=Myriangium duriaei CBS 260.36 TaxID=1168546 RepID=A0A9P4JBV0_9PEZI|nr:tRNA pseudouridine synthase D [Myriangium duriaei CBS 260.36]
MEESMPVEEHPRKRVRLENADETDAGQERKFGVTAFVSDTPGFSCIFKQRYTDFLVNEIQPSGQVVHLIDDGVANGDNNTHDAKDTNAQAGAEQQETKQQKAAEHEAGGKPSEEPANASISGEDQLRLESIFGAETASALLDLYAKIVAHPGRKARDHPQHTSDAIEDKQKRTDAHVAVRNIFRARIDTITLDNNCIHIKAASPSKQNGRQPPQRGEGPRTKGKVGWEELGGEYLHFSLYKENKDTMEVLYFLASQMKMHTKNFQFAGTKDRRGVTVQRVSAFRVTKDRLIGLNQRLKQARLSGFEHKKQGLQLGDLSGNEFTIVLRSCHLLASGSEAENNAQMHTTVSSAMDALRTKGFLNYYGLQRFGSFSTSTDEIGKLMLQGDLEGAVAGILTFNPAALLEEAESTDSNSKISRDDRARAQALDAWNKTHKTGNAVEKLPRKFQAENAIIRHLGHVDKRSGQQRQLGDWQNALMQIARNLRLMYVHAYQSLVWNAVAARRRELFGDKVVEGDLVIVEQESADANGGQDEVDDEGEVIIRPTGADSATAVEDKFERARPLSAEEAASDRYTIFDIVLPLPGYDVVYPPNDVGEYYKEFMGRDDLDPHNMRRKWRDISLSGSYRKVMARAEGLSYEIKSYAEEDEQLVLTDAERLEGKEEPNPSSSGTKTAVILKLQLASSQYATMALRELTKGGALAFKPDYSGR